MFQQPVGAFPVGGCGVLVADDGDFVELLEVSDQGISVGGDPCFGWRHGCHPGQFFTIGFDFVCFDGLDRLSDVVEIDPVGPDVLAQ